MQSKVFFQIGGACRQKFFRTAEKYRELRSKHCAASMQEMRGTITSPHRLPVIFCIPAKLFLTCAQALPMQKIFSARRKAFAFSAKMLLFIIGPCEIFSIANCRIIGDAIIDVCLKISNRGLAEAV